MDSNPNHTNISFEWDRNRLKWVHARFSRPPDDVAFQNKWFFKIFSPAARISMAVILFI